MLCFFQSAEHRCQRNVLVLFFYECYAGFYFFAGGNFLKRSIKFLITFIIAVCLLSGCRGDEGIVTVPFTEPLAGGPVDNSYMAPKEIESESIISFSCHFFLFGDYGSEGDSAYDFKVEKNGAGKYILSEEIKGISCETDESLLKCVQEIIKKNGLAGLNGTDKHTAGLPPEYQPNSFRAKYDSGEELYFSTDNEPEGGWGEDILKLMRKEFDSHGVYTLDPPPETKNVVRCNVIYVDGDKYYRFNEINVLPEDPENENAVRLELEEGNRKEKNYTCLYGDPDEKYYGELSRILEENEIAEFDNHEEPPHGFQYNEVPNCYEIYIEFEYGNHIKGFSSDTELNEQIRPVMTEILKLVKAYAADESMYPGFSEEEKDSLPADGPALSLSSASDWRKEEIADLSIWDGKWYLSGNKDAAYINIENGIAELSEDVHTLEKFRGAITPETVKETHSYDNMDVESESLILTADCGDRKAELMNICYGEVLSDKESGAFFVHESLCGEGELTELLPAAVLMSLNFEQTMRNDKAYFLPDGLLVLSGFDAENQGFTDNAAGIWSAETSWITVEYFDGTEETFEFDPYGEACRFYLDHTGSDYIGFSVTE